MFFGLSAKGALTPEMVKSMAPKPIIFAMANPDPEITPEEAHAVRADAIIATGRSDYPNQVNNVLGFPYIFRGALDVRATTINEEMKIAAAKALAELAARTCPTRSPPPIRARARASAANTSSRAVRSAPDPRRAAGRGQGGDGYAAWRASRSSTWTPTRRSSRRGAIRSPARCSAIFERVRRYPKRVVFAEGEEEQVIRAAIVLRQPGARHAPSWSAARSASPRSPPSPASTSTDAASRSTTRACRTATRPMPNTSTSACSARATCSATASA